LNKITDEPSVETEPEDSTYYDSKRMLKICSTCDGISTVFLILAVLVALLGVWGVVQTIPSAGSIAGLVAQAGPNFILFGFFTLLCLFFWVFLRAVSEGLYLLMDIQDNTSRAHAGK
jgi:hypothetical protein